MSTFDVRIIKIEAIEPIEGADRVELARVGLYRSVVPKGEYQAGELALYIPEQAIVPEELLEEIGLSGKLAGSKKNRVKAMRFRGSLSQGIVCRPKVFFPERYETESLAFDLYQKEANVAKGLGITKWAPEVPASMNGEAFACPDLIRWIDIENVKRYPDVFTTSDVVMATEKIHGTAFCMTVDFVESAPGGAEPPVLAYVTSKGMGAKGLAIEYSKSNVYWKAAEKYNLAEKIREFVDKWKKDMAVFGEKLVVLRVGLFGEVYGKGIQDLQYGTEEAEFACFDLFVETAEGSAWFNYYDIRKMLDVPMVPLLYVGPYDADQMFELAEGKEQVSGTEACIREGVVVRPLTERHSDELGGRAILKFVSETYLLRKNGSEFD